MMHVQVQKPWNNHKLGGAFSFIPEESGESTQQMKSDDSVSPGMELIRNCREAQI